MVDNEKQIRPSIYKLTYKLIHCNKTMDPRHKKSNNIIHKKDETRRMTGANRVFVYFR